jgi:hypothetical protein
LYFVKSEKFLVTTRVLGWSGQESAGKQRGRNGTAEMKNPSKIKIGYRINIPPPYPLSPRKTPPMAGIGSLISRTPQKDTVVLQKSPAGA